MGGTKTDGEMDRESKCGKMVNLAKGYMGVPSLHIPVCEREKYMGVFPSFLQAEIFQNYKFKKFAF